MRAVLAIMCSAAVGCVASETQPPWGNDAVERGNDTVEYATGTTDEPAAVKAMARSETRDEPAGAVDTDMAMPEVLTDREGKAEPMETSDHGEGGAEGIAAPGTVLKLPMEPRDMGTLDVAFEIDAGSLTLTPGEGSLTLATGKGYPKGFRALVASRLQCLTAVRSEVSSVAVGQAGLDVQAIGADALEFRIGEPGTYAVTVMGHLTAEEPFMTDREPCVQLLGSGAAIDFQLDLTVDVRRVGGALVQFMESCRGYMLSGSGFRVSSLDRAPWSEELRVRALDEQGAIFDPENASYRAPVGVSVHASAETRLTLRSGSEPGFEHPTRGKGGLIMLVAEGPDQRVSVYSASGEAGGFELVGPDRINGMRVQFQQEFGYGKARPVELVPGNTFAAPASDDGIKPTWINARVSDLKIGTETVCSDAPDGAFELRSLTPKTCAVAAEPLWDPVHTAPDALASANVVELGPCALELEAPAFDSGRGVLAAISVDFE